MLKYSLSPSPFPNSQPLEGAAIPTGTKIYIYYEPINTGEKLPYSFWDNGVKIGNNESQVPYEVMGGAGWTPAAGNHKLEVKDKNMVVLESCQFTVGTSTPPPSNLKTITLKLKSDNSEVAKISYDETKCDLVQ